MATSSLIAPKYKLQFDARRASEAEKKIQWISQQLSGAKTLRQWIDRSSGKIKLFRRNHFSSFLKQKMPQVVNHGFTMVIFPTDRGAKADSFTIYPDRTGLLHFYNGFNVTPLKKESFTAWKTRVKAILNKKSRSAWHQTLIPKAFARTREFNLPMHLQMIGGLSLFDWTLAVPEAGMDDFASGLIGKAQTLREKKWFEL